MENWDLKCGFQITSTLRGDVIILLGVKWGHQIHISQNPSSNFGHPNNGFENFRDWACQFLSNSSNQTGPKGLFVEFGIFGW